MQQREEHFLFLVAIHGWKIPVLELYKNLVLVFSSPPAFIWLPVSWGFSSWWMPHTILSTAIIQSTGLKSEWNFHIIWTTLPVWFSFFSHFHPIHTVNTTWTLKEIRNQCKEFLTFTSIAMSAISKSRKLV